jgi:hypothetical protein
VTVERFEILYGLVLPALLAALLSVPVLIFRRHGIASKKSLWLHLGLGVPFVVGFGGLFGVPRLPVAESWQWLFYIVAGITAFGIVDSLWRAPMWARATGALLVAEAFAWLLLWPLIENNWADGHPLFWIEAFSLALFFSWLGLNSLSNRISGAQFSFALLPPTVAVPLVVMLSGYRTIGPMGGIPFACIAAMLPIMWFASVTYGRGPVLLWIVMCYGLLAAGYFFANATTGNCMLLLVSPQMAWVGELPPFRRWRPAARGALRVAAVAMPAFVAVGLAGASFARQQSEENSGMTQADGLRTNYVAEDAVSQSAGREYSAGVGAASADRE